MKQSLIYSSGSQVLSTARNPEFLGSLIETQVLNPPQTSTGNPGWGPGNPVLVTNPFECNKAFKGF